MASACIKTIGLSPATHSSYTWLNPRLKLNREIPETKRISSDLPVNDCEDQPKKISDLVEETDLNEFDGFEFRLEDPVMMLPADELFSDGKLVPLKFSVVRQEVATSTTTVMSGVSSPDTPYSRRITGDNFAVDPYLISPRAPRCSSRWRELLGFGKHQSNINNNIAKIDDNNNKRTTSLPLPSSNGATRSIRQLLHRSSKSHDSSVNLPLLEDLDNESVSISSRPSLSSSSSGHDLDDLPRLSLDSDKPSKLHLTTNRPKTRMVKTREARVTTRSSRTTARRSSDTTVTTTDRCLSIDSPRMNSSGKIVFHSLERSSSSPSSLNGGPRFKHRGMERSYSANVRVTPVLNVPVCSLRGSSKTGGMFGFPMFASKHKREGSINNGGQNRSPRFIAK